MKRRNRPHTVQHSNSSNMSQMTRREQSEGRRSEPSSERPSRSWTKRHDGSSRRHERNERPERNPRGPDGYNNNPGNVIPSLLNIDTSAQGPHVFQSNPVKSEAEGFPDEQVGSAVGQVGHGRGAFLSEDVMKDLRNRSQQPRVGLIRNGPDLRTAHDSMGYPGGNGLLPPPNIAQQPVAPDEYEYLSADQDDNGYDVEEYADYGNYDNADFVLPEQYFDKHKAKYEAQDPLPWHGKRPEIPHYMQGIKRKTSQDQQCGASSNHFNDPAMAYRNDNLTLQNRAQSRTSIPNQYGNSDLSVTLKGENRTVMQEGPQSKRRNYGNMKYERDFADDFNNSQEYNHPSGTFRNPQAQQGGFLNPKGKISRVPYASQNSRNGNDQYLNGEDVNHNQKMEKLDHSDLPADRLNQSYRGVYTGIPQTSQFNKAQTSQFNQNAAFNKPGLLGFYPNRATGMSQQEHMPKLRVCDFCQLTYQDYNIHVRSAEHKQHYQQSLNRMKATEHLRTIEMMNPKSSERRCTTCSINYSGTWDEHIQTTEHKRKFRLMRRGCILCKTGQFEKYPDYVKHIDSLNHKKRKAELNDERKMETASESAESEVENQENLGPSEQSSRASSKSPVRGRKISTSPARKQGSPSSRTQEDANIDQALHPQPNATNETAHQPETVVIQPRNMESQNPESANLTLASTLDPQTSDPLAPIGTEFVIRTTGWFCRLCMKFFQDGQNAQNHCVKPLHAERYMAAIQKKVVALQKNMKKQKQAEDVMFLKEENSKQIIADHNKKHIENKEVQETKSDTEATINSNVQETPKTPSQGSTANATDQQTDVTEETKQS